MTLASIRLLQSRPRNTLAPNILGTKYPPESSMSYKFPTYGAVAIVGKCRLVKFAYGTNGSTISPETGGTHLPPLGGSPFVESTICWSQENALFDQ